MSRLLVAVLGTVILGSCTQHPAAQTSSPETNQHVDAPARELTRPASAADIDRRLDELEWHLKYLHGLLDKRGQRTPI